VTTPRRWRPAHWGGHPGGSVGDDVVVTQDLGRRSGVMVDDAEVFCLQGGYGFSRARNS
jgi:hypothetical protein